jgi:polyisoprenoid-binding protein YceI
VSKNNRTAAAKVTANINIHPEDPQQSDVNFTNPTSTVELQFLTL